MLTSHLHLAPDFNNEWSYTSISLHALMAWTATDIIISLLNYILYCFPTAIFFYSDINKTRGRDSSVGIATRYRLDGQGFEFRWGRYFRNRSDWPWGPPSLLYNGYRVPFPGVRRPCRGVVHPPANSADVKERVEPYLYSPSIPIVACFRVNFTLCLHI
jgi:hypothetical protein